MVAAASMYYCDEWEKLKQTNEKNDDYVESPNQIQNYPQMTRKRAAPPEYGL